MSSESILLVGSDAGNARDVFQTHASRLAKRTAVDRVDVATYETEPTQELRDQLTQISAERVYAVPMQMAHSYDTTGGIPAALSYLSGDVTYCEPAGRSPAMTNLIEAKAADLVQASGDASLVLIGFGSSSKPYHRQTLEYHATRLREQSDYGEVVECYLLQNPAVECVRYTLSNEVAVAVPLFFHQTEATEEHIPEKLELERGGLEYASPLGEHTLVTDAIHAEIEKQRVLTDHEPPGDNSFETRLTRTERPVATDGNGQQRAERDR